MPSLTLRTASTSRMSPCTRSTRGSFSAVSTLASVPRTRLSKITIFAGAWSRNSKVDGGGADEAAATGHQDFRTPHAGPCSCGQGHGWARVPQSRVQRDFSAPAREDPRHPNRGGDFVLHSDASAPDTSAASSSLGRGLVRNAGSRPPCSRDPRRPAACAPGSGSGCPTGRPRGQRRPATLARSVVRIGIDRDRRGGTVSRDERRRRRRCPRSSSS